MILTLLFSMAVFADDVIRVEYGKNSDRDMKWRLQRLEQAVDQLQRKVFELETSAKPVAAAMMATCYIKTPFDGTFTATEATYTAAKASVLEKCNAKAKGSIYCEEKNMVCGK